MIHLTNRFYGAVCLYNYNRSQITSKYGTNKKVHLLFHLCSYHILASSLNYDCTDPQKRGIFWSYMLTKKRMVMLSMPLSSNRPQEPLKMCVGFSLLYNFDSCFCPLLATLVISIESVLDFWTYVTIKKHIWWIFSIPHLWHCMHGHQMQQPSARNEPWHQLQWLFEPMADLQNTWNQWQMGWEELGTYTALQSQR